MDALTLAQSRPPAFADAAAAASNETQRIKYVLDHWHSQDDLLRPRDRQLEENVRMIAGLQWSVYDKATGQFLDPTQWMTEAERKWRMRPVLNRILPWFILTHARLTENAPIVTFLPGPDRADAILAETMDTVYKALWRELGMDDIHDRAMMWMIAGGRSYIQSRIDLTRGAMREWRGWGEVPVVGPDGPVTDAQGQPVTMPWEDVPFAADGSPQMVMTPDGPQQTGPAHATPEGGIVMDVFSCAEVRGQWGPQPWHEKAWHMTKAYLTPSEVYDLTGVEAEPDVRGDAARETGELQRLLFGAGYWGAASSAAPMSERDAAEGYCEVYSLWERPKLSARNPDLQPYVKGEGSAGGRLLMVTPKKVLRDGPRPADFKYTSPIRAFGFLRTPGRPHESTLLEALNPIQRAYNRGASQILEHRALCTNPIFLIDTASGLGNVKFTNQPGSGYEVLRRPGVAAIEWIAPPALGADVWQGQAMLQQELAEIGSQQGPSQAGEQPTRDASGEMLKELRFDNDRFLGPTQKRNVVEYGRTVEDWMVLLPLVWDQQKIISYAGEDNVARTLAVLPDMLTGGKVNVVPDMESMLPEGRGERQARIYRMYMDGMFGLPGSPEALKRFFELARFPHLSRTAKPGGVDAVMAAQFLGMIVQGATLEQIPYFDWYDCTIHKGVFEDFMKGPEYLRLDPEVQNQMRLVWMRYQIAEQQKLLAAAQQQAMVQGIVAGPGGPGGPARGGKPQPGSAKDAEADADQRRVGPDDPSRHAPEGRAAPTGLMEPAL